MESVSLAELPNNCWQNVETGDATLQTKANRTIRADPNRLAQLFENLMRNAVEHTSQDVTVTIGELDDGFYVEDDGSGIPEDSRDDAFEAEYTTADEGTGFGLSIVKEVADAHGWDITITEGSEGGARFEITNVDFETS
jgi:signal transduction histidine kinase